MLTRSNCQLPSLFTDFKIRHKNTKIVIFYFTDSLVWYMLNNVIIHLSVGEKPSIFTSPHSRLGDYPGLFTATSVNNCTLSTSREVDNEPMAGVNPRFAEGTEKRHLANAKDQNITILNGTKKATNLGMKVSREKQCFNTQFAHISSVFCPDRQVLLMLLSWSNNCPSRLHFKVPSKSTHLPLNKTSPFKKV